MIKSIKNINVNFIQALFLIMMLFSFELFSFIPEYIKVDSTINNIFFRAVFLLITISVIIKKGIYFNNSLTVVALFWLFYLSRMFYETVFYFDRINIDIIELWTFAVFLCVFPMFAASSKFSIETISVAKKGALVFLVVINVLGLINNNISLEQTEIYIRADGNISLNTVSFGRTATLLIVLSGFFLKRKAYTINLILIGFIFLGLINIFIAGSRGPLVQLVSFYLIYFFINFRNIKFSYFLLLLPFLYYLYDYIVKYEFLFTALFDSVFNSGFGNNASDNIRSELISSAWNQFLNNPFFGDSLETNYLGTYPHNIFIESLMSIGLIGGVFIIIIYYQGLKSCFICLKRNDFNWLSAILIIQFISCLTSGSIISSVLLWPLLVLILNKNRNINKTKNFK